MIKLIRKSKINIVILKDKNYIINIVYHNKVVIICKIKKKTNFFYLSFFQVKFFVAKIKLEKKYILFQNIFNFKRF